MPDTRYIVVERHKGEEKRLSWTRYATRAAAEEEADGLFRAAMDHTYGSPRYYGIVEEEVPDKTAEPGIVPCPQPKEPRVKKILYIDMDNVLVDFRSAIPRLDPELVEAYGRHLDDVPGIFALMDPMSQAVASFRELARIYDTYILSTSPWKNPSAWSDKLLWVQQYLGGSAKKRLILTHHKNLNVGDYLIDDRRKHGVPRFCGEHIHFGTKKYPDWPAVMAYLRPGAEQRGQ